jgi:hypothetical protein
MMVMAAMVEPQKAARNTGASGPVQGWKKHGFKKKTQWFFFIIFFIYLPRRESFLGTLIFFVNK